MVFNSTNLDSTSPSDKDIVKMTFKLRDEILNDHRIAKKAVLTKHSLLCSPDAIRSDRFIPYRFNSPQAELLFQKTPLKTEANHSLCESNFKDLV